MGTVFRCWVSRCAAAPDGVDGCLVIPGTRRFQIAVCIDAEEMIGGEEEDGGNLSIFFCELEVHDWMLTGVRAGEGNNFFMRC